MRTDAALEELARCYPLAHHEPPDPRPGERWALVERNTIDVGEHFISLHSTPQAALAYHCQQEEPQWWQPLVLVDLTDGSRHEVQYSDVRHANVEIHSHGRSRQVRASG